MTPEISEFSYGFALTNQLVSWTSIHTAPIFPSLLEEGKAGGGYDVKLGFPGVPLYLQFKRGYRMTRRSAGEIQGGKTKLNVPFHRFHITESGKSRQHVMLMDLASRGALVFYAAPRFDRQEQMNAAWRDNTVAQRSIFVRPNEIGLLNDEQHHVAYDARYVYVCSDPRPIHCLSALELLVELTKRLREEPAPLSDRLGSFESQLVQVKERARIAVDSGPLAERALPPLQTIRILGELSDSGLQPDLPKMPSRNSRRLDESQAALRRLADTAMRDFNCQLVIVQDAKAASGKA